MGEDAGKVFRLDNEVLAFRFTATLSHRAGSAPLERLTSPERLRLWLGAVGLDPKQEVTDQQLALALMLRETTYRVGLSVTRGEPWEDADAAVLNSLAAAGRPAPVLARDGRRWKLSAEAPVSDGLAVIASDAVATYATNDGGRIKICDGPDCRGLFLDTSRGNNRRWCSMNTCGNRAKKARMNAR
ncbi:MAG: CGNR zinc finger domain-containing protein [Acidipropionibacterium acidipropionici]|nr:CGNR zinc finger domain-containing protein [Acidipropionibacterium acidipropionici]